MNRAACMLLIIVWCLLPGTSGQAHSVHVFAQAENGTIKGEGYLSGGKKVVNGEIQVYDKEANRLLLTTQTDKQGLFSFPIDQLNLDHTADLIIVLNAGPGHRSQWELNSDQYSIPGQPDHAAMPAASATTPSKDKAPAANPPLINIVAGIVCIFGIGGIISFIKSRKRGSS